MKIIKTLEQAYKKAPYYEETIELIQSILENKVTSLGSFLGNSLKEIAMYFGIKTQFIYSSSLGKDNSLKGQDKVIDICKILNATEYYNTIAGQELYNSDDFTLNGIDFKFLKTNPIEYSQFDNQFIPWLSIIDVMMFNSVEEIKAMLGNYILA